MKSGPWFLLALAFGLGCSGGAASDTATDTAGGVSNAVLRSSCRWPSGVQAAGVGAATQGCGAWDAFNVCEVATDGTKSCRNVCDGARFALACNEASASPAWGCEIIPVPTMAGWSDYCCPCQ